ncbi:ABC transporter permease subunit [Nonomuraea sp. NPDC050556]|uniref:ABC transporter permease subunit n=1 Tax=Nonomuraea sp. NPDC050556 TaxID=3364369 RepID=UPI0037A52262
MTTFTSEWIKLRSVRSTHLLLAIALGAVGLAALIAVSAVGAYEASSPARRATARMAELDDVVVAVPQLCLGILGVLAMTSEYATGLIRVSLTAVPRRWPVLAAKGVLVSACALVVGPVVVFGTAISSRAIVDGRYPLLPLADRVPLMVVSSLSVVVFALLGLGLGAVLRNAAAAIAVVVGVVYVIPMIVGNLPEPWSERLGSGMIGALPGEITGADLTNSVYGSLLPPWAAVLVLVAYAAVPVLLGFVLLRRRDA